MTRPPKAEDLPTLERKLKGVRQEVRNLQVMQMCPNQPAEKLKLLSELELSARADEVSAKGPAAAQRAGRSSPRYGLGCWCVSQTGAEHCHNVWVIRHYSEAHAPLS